MPENPTASVCQKVGANVNGVSPLCFGPTFHLAQKTQEDLYFNYICPTDGTGFEFLSLKVFTGFLNRLAPRIVDGWLEFPGEGLRSGGVVVALDGRA